MPAAKEAQDEGTAAERQEKTNAELGAAQDVGSSNPFAAEGELSRKADYIISHSTITRTEIHIADPDNPDSESNITAVVCSGELCAGRPTDLTAGGQRENGGKPVEAEVRQTKVSSPEQEKAEQVKLTDDKKPCKCCLIQ